MIVLPDEQTAKHIFQNLLERGVIIRPLTTTGLPNCLRISVGTPEENQYFIETLKDVSGHSVL
jgi:histidinol-phosphate aminotransferase